jgi:hypothetical protein
MMGNKNSAVAKKQEHQYPLFANSPHRPQWAFQTTPGFPVTSYILGKPTMGSFPVCPPYGSAYLAPTGAFIIPPYPAYNSHEPMIYSLSGSSHATSRDPPSPVTGNARPKSPPKTFKITIPKTGRQIKVMFVERVTHITAPVEYGIVPVDPDERAELKARYNMEVLNSTPMDNIAFRTFYVDDKWMKEGSDSILGQLQSLGIVKPVKRVHYEPFGNFLVKLLLQEEEVRYLSLLRSVSRADYCGGLPRSRMRVRTRVTRILYLSLQRKHGLVSVHLAWVGWSVLR